MKKLAAVLIASLVVSAACAQASAPAADVAKPASGSKVNKQEPDNHETKSIILDKSKLDEGGRLQ